MDARERIERARESLHRMEHVIDRHAIKPTRSPPQKTRGDNWNAADRAGGVVRGASKTPAANRKK